MGPESSLPCSQKFATGPCTEPDKSSPQFPTLFPKIHVYIIFPSKSRKIIENIFIKYDGRIWYNLMYVQIVILRAVIAQSV
jgi:hypothetical protein